MSLGFTPHIGKADRRILSGGTAPSASAASSSAPASDAGKGRKGNRRFVIVIHSRVAQRMLRLKRR